ncbi:hypothetical protein [Rhizorhabdus dicambivorans]|uniref:Uncharacterized protein n=2 Tax=Rhizorhabdus dicambivorans TaxID=1850238 RepID=A0A2A4FZY5_9SPHN|nr:hypothetical protein [Rhizorhabdus dicambivorans]PCE43064.1 hypothetical protein COO09_07120 [Rhizorhabdus dicambivorans]
MNSQDIRWIIAGLFVAFLAVIVLSDLVKRKPKGPRTKARKAPKARGFRTMRTDRPAPGGGTWKNPGRR